jgi:translation initiation factor 4A
MIIGTPGKVKAML